MPLFTSHLEKRLWFCVITVLIAIFSMLFIGQPLINLLSNQDIQAIFFLLGMLLVAIIILMHGLKTTTSRTEIIIIVGILAVFVMFFLRLGLTERSHLIEYSVLAIFTHKALLERQKNSRHVPMPALLAFMTTFLIGVLDEAIQIILPNRIFDVEDIIFNGMAAAMATPHIQALSTQLLSRVVKN